MRIFVVGTPRTGNNWVKHLLAEVYDLPIVEIDARLDPEGVAAAGEDWVAHQHLMPSRELIDWAKENEVFFVTPLRHPGDVLISLWHYVRSNPTVPASDLEFGSSASDMRGDGDRLGHRTLHFVERAFYSYLNLSIAWLRTGVTRPVRYESLWEHPLETLKQLTDSIAPVTDKQLVLAAWSCEFNLMRLIHDPQAKVIRHGGCGAWMNGLTAEIKRTLATAEPYPEQMRALGYNWNEQDPANSAPRGTADFPGTISLRSGFANGVPAAPIIVRAFYEADAVQRARWLDPRLTSADSFYSWLNRRAAGDQLSPSDTIPVTELANFIHSIRADVRSSFPEPFGQDRAAFLEWFYFTAASEYGLDPTFTSDIPFPRSGAFADGTRMAPILKRAYLDLPGPMRRAWPDPAAAGNGTFLAWLNSPASHPRKDEAGPMITQLGAYLYSNRPDVRGLMTDPYGAHRLDFASWFVYSARHEYELDHAFILPVIRSWASPQASATALFEPSSIGARRVGELTLSERFTV